MCPVVRGRQGREDVVTAAVPPGVSLAVLASGVSLLLRKFNRCRRYLSLYNNNNNNGYLYSAVYPDINYNNNINKLLDIFIFFCSHHISILNVYVNLCHT